MAEKPVCSEPFLKYSLRVSLFFAPALQNRTIYVTDRIISNAIYILYFIFIKISSFLSFYLIFFRCVWFLRTISTENRQSHTPKTGVFYAFRAGATPVRFAEFQHKPSKKRRNLLQEGKTCQKNTICIRLMPSPNSGSGGIPLVVCWTRIV